MLGLGSMSFRASFYTFAAILQRTFQSHPAQSSAVLRSIGTLDGQCACRHAAPPLLQDALLTRPMHCPSDVLRVSARFHPPSPSPGDLMTAHSISGLASAATCPASPAAPTGPSGAMSRCLGTVRIGMGSRVPMLTDMRTKVGSVASRVCVRPVRVTDAFLLPLFLRVHLISAQ
ncbi:unnamed protein product [Tilletia caries]|nr:unnamed protein product [Tilletia caries]